MNSHTKQESIQPRNTFLGLLMLFFVLLNAIKTTVVTFHIIGPESQHYAGKLIINLGLSGLIYLALVRYNKWKITFIFYISQILFLFSHLSYKNFFDRILYIPEKIKEISYGISMILEGSFVFSNELLILLLDLPLLLFLFFSTHRIQSMISKNKLKVRYSLAAFFILFFTQQTIYYVDESFASLARKQSLQEKLAVTCYGFIGHNMAQYLISDKKKDVIPNIQYGPLSKANFKKTQATIPIIFIQVEAFESGAPHYTWNGKKVMPFMNALTRKSIYYPFCFSYHLGGFSSDAEFSIVNNLEAFKFWNGMYLGYNHPNSFIRQFKNQGYVTKAFHNNHKSFFNRAPNYEQMGYMDFLDITDMGYSRTTFGAPDEPMFDYVSESIKTEIKPYFYTIITMSTHVKWNYYKKFNYHTDELFTGITDKLTRDYFASLNYFDTVIKKFIDKVYFNAENKPMIVIYGDHASNHKSKYKIDPNIRTLGKRLEFVPLYILTPENTKAYKHDQLASFHDLGPTALNKAKISYEIKKYGNDILKDKSLNPIPYLGDSLDREKTLNLIKDNIQKESKKLPKKNIAFDLVF